MKYKKGFEMTLQTIIVIVLLLIVAAVMLFIFQSQIGRSEGILDNTQQNLENCQNNPDSCFVSKGTGESTANPDSPPHKAIG